MATKSSRSSAPSAAEVCFAAAQRAMVLAEILREQANDLLLAAQQPSVHWGHAGDAQSLLHDMRKLGMRPLYKAAGNCEDLAGQMLDGMIDHKIAKRGGL